MNIQSEQARHIRPATRRFTTLLFIAGISSAAWSAPATRPAKDLAARNGPFSPNTLNGGAGGGGPPRSGPNDRPNLSPENTHAAIEFFNANSPNRMAFFNRLNEGTSKRQFITLQLVKAYRPIENFKQTSPDLYDLLVNQLKLRDEAFLLSKSGDSRGLQTKVEQIIDVSLKARSMRIDLLEKQLEAQQQQLVSDRSDTARLVETELHRIKDDQERLTNQLDRPQRIRGPFGTAPVPAPAVKPTTQPLNDAASAGVESWPDPLADIMP